MHETKYMNETDLKRRREYGQFFTPPLIAHIMAMWVMKENPRTILDPAFGLGVFYEEVAKCALTANFQFVGFEIDGHILNYFEAKEDNSNLTIVTGDYLESGGTKYDAIICNPPYMRFQKFLRRHVIVPKIERITERKLVGYTNLSSVFLIKALNELNVNGRLAFIMPSEFLNTGYGTEIKKNLLEGNLLKQIVIFDNEKDVFPDVTTTVCIILCSNDNRLGPIKITQVKCADEMMNMTDLENTYQLEIAASALPHDRKWMPIFNSMLSTVQIPDGLLKLSFYGSFVRGIATGANEFFALSKSRIDEWNLGHNVCECITKSSQIRKLVFTQEDFRILGDSGQRVYCLDVRDHDALSVRAYIAFGEEQDLHKRYLTKKRDPWYRIENRSPSPLLFGVFNRGRLKVIRNYTDAINFTCFHSFYPNMFGVQNINRLFAYLLSDQGQTVVKMNKRNYGDNLDKLEPGDLNNSFCPSQRQFEMVTDWEAEKVVELAKSNPSYAIEFANLLMNRIFRNSNAESNCTKT